MFRQKEVYPNTYYHVSESSHGNRKGLHFLRFKTVSEWPGLLNPKSSEVLRVYLFLAEMVSEWRGSLTQNRRKY